MTYGAWVNPGDETHRYGVHNNGGGGRAEVVYVVYVVNHKEPEIQCSVKRLAQDVRGR